MPCAACHCYTNVAGKGTSAFVRREVSILFTYCAFSYGFLFCSEKRKYDPFPYASLSLPASRSKHYERIQNKNIGVHNAPWFSCLTSRYSVACYCCFRGNGTVLMNRNVVQQMYLRNCALCVLSRFGITDDIWEIKNCESNFEFVESIHLAGQSKATAKLSL